MEVNKEELGKRIKKIRLDLGETAEQFGNRFDPKANRSLVSAWENGRYKPAPERLKQIAELGDTTVDKLLYGKIDSKYDVEKLRNAIEETTLADFDQVAFDNVVNAINEADFLDFGLTDVAVMYSNNLLEEYPDIKDLKSLLEYLKTGHKNMSHFLDVIPEEKYDVLMDLNIELLSIQHQINEIEKRLK